MRELVILKEKLRNDRRLGGRVNLEYRPTGNGYLGFILIHCTSSIILYQKDRVLYGLDSSYKILIQNLEKICIDDKKYEELIWVIEKILRDALPPKIEAPDHG